jgi:hypothetical protein
MPHGKRSADGKQQILDFKPPTRFEKIGDDDGKSSESVNIVTHHATISTPQGESSRIEFPESTMIN